MIPIPLSLQHLHNTPSDIPFYVDSLKMQFLSSAGPPHFRTANNCNPIPNLVARSSELKCSIRRFAMFSSEKEVVDNNDKRRIARTYLHASSRLILPPIYHRALVMCLLQLSSPKQTQSISSLLSQGELVILAISIKLQKWCGKRPLLLYWHYGSSSNVMRRPVIYRSVMQWSVTNLFIHPSMFTRNTVRKLPELKQLAEIATADIIFIAEICPRYIISWFIAFIKLGIQIFPEQSCRGSVNKMGNRSLPLWWPNVLCWYLLEYEVLCNCCSSPPFFNTIVVQRVLEATASFRTPDHHHLQGAL